jgi:hypothetical protein
MVVVKDRKAPFLMPTMGQILITVDFVLQLNARKEKHGTGRNALKNVSVRRVHIFG